MHFFYYLFAVKLDSRYLAEADTAAANRLLAMLVRRSFFDMTIFYIIKCANFKEFFFTYYKYNLVEDLDIRPEILFSSAWSLFALLKGRANKDQNILFVFHSSHSA